MQDPEITIVIPIYHGVTHLDFTGPHQFLARTPRTRVIVASIDGEPIESYGLVFSELAALPEIERCDVLLVPGGAGCHQAIESNAFLDEIRRLGKSARYLTSVCTGSLVLAAAGLLVGKRAACHWAWRELLPHFGAIPDSDRVVKDGNILSGGGVTAGIDFALSLIAELHGESVAQSMQLLLEYAPQPPFNSGRPETAPSEVVDTVLRHLGPTFREYKARIEKVAASLPLHASASIPPDR